MAQSEADRLLNLGLEQYKQSQFRAALRYWQQALTLYREIGDSLEDRLAARQGEGNTLWRLPRKLAIPLGIASLHALWQGMP